MVTDKENAMCDFIWSEIASAGSTYEKFAEAVGVSSKTVRNWTTKQCAPQGIDVLSRIAEVLNVSVSELIRGSRDSVDRSTAEAILDTIEERNKEQDKVRRMEIAGLFLITSGIVFLLIEMFAVYPNGFTPGFHGIIEITTKMICIFAGCAFLWVGTKLFCKDEKTRQRIERWSNKKKSSKKS